jgi:DNA sulfur modification protein DndC
MARRAGLYNDLEGALRRHFYTSEEDATARALRKQEALESVGKAREEKDTVQLALLPDESSAESDATRVP